MNRAELSMFRLAVCVVLLSVCQAELTCVRCNQVRGEEQKCNDKNKFVTCRDSEVCTIDVRCDGRDRPFWIKGCERLSGITAMHEVICQDDLRRCNYHCDTGDECNEYSPDGFINRLVCTPNITTTTTEPPVPLVEDLSCECLVRGDPYLVQMDNGLTLITSPQTTLLSRFAVPPVDPCKFQLLIDTVQSGPDVIIDSVELSVGVPGTNVNNFMWTFRIGCNVMEVDTFGQGTSPLSPGDSFFNGDSTFFVDEGNGKVIVRSDLCPMELDYYCDGGDGKPYVRFAINEEYYVRPGNQLRGICGDCNGEMDDLRDCATGVDLSHLQPIEVKYGAVSDSCAFPFAP